MTFDLKLLRSSVWSLTGQAGRVALQAALFVFLSRGLGVKDFGLYMALLAMAQLVFPFSGLGAHNMMVMRVARRPRLLDVYLRHTLVMLFLSGVFLSVVLTVISGWLYQGEAPLWALGLVIFTELVAFRLVDASTHAHQALEKLHRTAGIQVLLSAVRAAIACTLFFSGQLQFSIWVGLNFFCTLGVGVLALAWTVRSERLRFWPPRFFSSEISQGLYFSLSGTSQALYTNTDKMMLSKLSGLQSVGLYSAAYRVIQMAFLPVLSVLSASYARFFRYGKSGLEDSLRFSLRLSPVFAIYGLLVGGGIYFAAPFLPLVLGAEYAESVPFLRMLSVLPLIQAAHHLVGDALTGAGRQRDRALLLLSAGLVNVVLNLLLIPQFGVRGAIIATLATEFMLFMSYVGVVCFLSNRRRILA